MEASILEVDEYTRYVHVEGYDLQKTISPSEVKYLPVRLWRGLSGGQAGRVPEVLGWSLYAIVDIVMDSGVGYQW